MRALRIPAILIVALLGGSALAVSGGTAAVAGTGAGTATGTLAVAAAGKTFTKTVERTNLVNGKTVVVDKRHISLHVNDITDLRGRQEIQVSWSGAHPTGGVIADPNSIDAQQEEYPMVLLECRGTGRRSAHRPAGPRTGTSASRARSTPPSRRTGSTATRPRRSEPRIVDAPKPRPKACFVPALSEYWVPFVSASGHTYFGGTAGCAGVPPESANAEGSSLPSNETFGASATDGHGRAKFDVWTEAENASLGCSNTVPCSLVAVPVEGISCDPAAKSLPAKDRPKGEAAIDAAAACEAKGAFAPGQTVIPEGDDDLAVSGSLWWSASNWRNRITIPLTFAPPANACAVVNSSSSVNVYGSELLSQATGQWLPHFCLNPKLFQIQHVAIGEPEARTLLAGGGASAAFTTDPQSGGYGKPVVQAPTALTGFAITYDIDGANGQEYRKLRLTPRLLAKLLTESYPAITGLKQLDPALSGNPLDITEDPEFQALNPGVKHGVDATQAAAELLALSSDSDVIEALTTYINDDPTARAWLNGKPDQWGMTVNPKYKGIKLPVNKWPLLDTFASKALYTPTSNDCLFTDPVPFLPLVASPMATLADISESMQFSIANSQTTCVQPVDGSSIGEKLVAPGRQTVGNRFMIGLSSLGDAARYQLDTAALQTSTDHFVLPSDTSLKTAASYLRPDPKAGSWVLPYKTLLTKAAAASAYPGTMLVNTVVPTKGLPSASARDYASFLRFVAGPGQQSGEGVGQLPAGYLPLTAANGLAKLARYSRFAASAVSQQRGFVPSLRHPIAQTVPHSGSTTGGGGGGGNTEGDSGSTPSGDMGSVPPAPAATTGSSPSGSTPVVATTSETTASLGRTLGIPLGPGSLAIVVILVLAVLGAIAGPGTYLLGRWKGRW